MSKLIDIHVRFTKEEYDKIRLLSYYTNKPKAEIVRIAVKKLKEKELKNEKSA